MNFRPCVTGRSLEHKLNRTGARTKPWGRPLRWGLQELVSLPMCTLKLQSRSRRPTSRVNQYRRRRRQGKPAWLDYSSEFGLLRYPQYMIVLNKLVPFDAKQHTQTPLVKCIDLTCNMACFYSVCRGVYWQFATDDGDFQNKKLSGSKNHFMIMVMETWKMTKKEQYNGQA